MKLVEPTDFEIMEVLDERGRNTAANIAVVLEKDRSYINTRLPLLADYGLVKRIGPAENSGLYELTPPGRVALTNREDYPFDDFDVLLDRELESP